MGEGEGEKIWESSIETYTWLYVKQPASGNLLYDAGSPKPVLCDNLEEVWDGEGVGRRFKREGTCVYLSHTCDLFMLMYGRNHHIIVDKIIIFQLK